MTEKDEVYRLVRSLNYKDVKIVDDDITSVRLIFDPTHYEFVKNKIETMKKQGVSDWGQTIYLLSQAENMPKLEEVKEVNIKVENDKND